MSAPRLLLLTDRSQLPESRDLVATVRAGVDAGLSHVVVREHDLEPSVRRRLVEDLASLDGLTVLSSRVPVPGAAGVHLAAGQPAPVSVWFGRSCHDVDEVGRAADEGAAYVTLSPFAASASKPGYGPPVPATDYAAGRGVPILALGGVEPANAADALVAGAHGVAVMGCVMRADDPGAVVRALLRAVGG
jgi:thiamine-phosphate pyrophosphorylase